MKADAIIQARVNSTRLRGKVLIEIGGKTVLEHVIERVKKSRYIKNTILATTDRHEDSRIADLADKLGVDSYRGSENDVLDRYYQTAKLYNAKHIVRITADCPLIDPDIIDDVISRYFESKSDYCSNTLEVTFPDGQDVEVFSFETLSIAWENAKLLSEREHVTPYIKNHPDRFKLAGFRNKVDLSDKRWTLDREEDLMFIRAVIAGLYPQNPDFGMEDIMEFIKNNPQIEDINKGIVRNEGYLKSLEDDK